MPNFHYLVCRYDFELEPRGNKMHMSKSGMLHHLYPDQASRFLVIVILYSEMIK